jgi:hypothetical protein
VNGLRQAGGTMILYEDLVNPTGIDGSALKVVKRARSLCVDDEEEVPRALVLHLGRRYELLTATSGAAALERLKHGPQVAVIIPTCACLASAARHS